MEPFPHREGLLREASRYSGIGCTFGAGVVLFAAGGWLLDGWLGVTPLFSVLGGLVGAALGVAWIYGKLIGARGGRGRDER